MKRIHFIVIGLIAAAAVSCGKQSPEFALTSETFNIGYEGGKIEIGYDIRNHVPGEKLIVTTETPWLTINSYNRTKATVSVMENFSRTEPREAQITLTYGGEKQRTVVIRQDYRKAVIKLDNPTVNFDNQKQSLMVAYEVTEPVPEATPDASGNTAPEWLKFHNTGKGLYLSVERNLSEEERSFDIVLKYPGADNACLKVVQGTDSEYMIIAETKWAKQNCGIDESNPYGKLYNYDEALTACPDGWRAPTRAEMSRLCTRYSDFEEVDGIRGRWFSGEETYSTQATRIFLPARGYRQGADGEIMEFSEGGHYICGEKDKAGNVHVIYFQYLKFSGTKPALHDTEFYGSLRCVKAD